MILLQRKCVFTLLKQTLCEVVTNNLALLVATHRTRRNVYVGGMN